MQEPAPGSEGPETANSGEPELITGVPEFPDSPKNTAPRFEAPPVREGAVNEARAGVLAATDAERDPNQPMNHVKEDFLRDHGEPVHTDTNGYGANRGERISPDLGRIREDNFRRSQGLPTTAERHAAAAEQGKPAAGWRARIGRWLGR